ncbi:MAG TPA: hypothetical protein VJ836_00685 [Candidatus Saccharimonadales bacterium]|nr:hypothetical protein [Candidatus Saccharimonadales bacterium]
MSNTVGRPTELTKVLKSQPRRIDLSAELNDSFYANRRFKIGSVLKFEKEGICRSFRIVRLNRKSKKCEAVEVQLYKEDEVDIVDKEKS